MSGAGEPGDERDWFRGARPAAGGRSPSPVAEAFGHVPKEKAAADGGSDWFRASFDLPPAGLSPDLPPEPSVPEPAPEAAPGPETGPETDHRVRLRALTGGLADLSDAMAAIGIESVAVSSNPARPATPKTTTPATPAPTPAADFRVRCPDCGPQFVAVADVRFVETGDGAEANRYLFTCPACGARVRRPAGPELAEILKTSGVATLALRRGPGQAL